MNFAKDSKAFYRFVSSKRRANCLPQPMGLADVEASEPQLIYNLFSKFFVQPYANRSVSDIFGYPYDIENYDIFLIIRFSSAEVFEGLCRLEFFCLFGPDGNFSSIVVKCADIIIKLITETFNFSLVNRVSPDVW